VSGARVVYVAYLLVILVGVAYSVVLGLLGR
jgi:hypothetical protein